MADFQSRMFSINLAEDDEVADITYQQPYFDHISLLYNAMDTIPLLEQYHLPTDTHDTYITIIRDQDNTFKYSAPAHTPLSLLSLIGMILPLIIFIYMMIWFFQACSLYPHIPMIIIYYF